jgi:hypothetical protein
LAKGAASTAGDDICTVVAVEVAGREFTTDDDGEKAAVTPRSAARERREIFIFLLSSSLNINYYYCNNNLREMEQCYWAEDDLRQSKFG